MNTTLILVIFVALLAARPLLRGLGYASGPEAEQEQRHNVILRDQLRRMGITPRTTTPPPTDVMALAADNRRLRQQIFDANVASGLIYTIPSQRWRKR